MKTFTIRIEGQHLLTVDEIWPDGDAPENPTVSDVVARIKKSCAGAYDLVYDWNLDVDVEVDGEPVIW